MASRSRRPNRPSPNNRSPHPTVDTSPSSLPSSETSSTLSDGLPPFFDVSFSVHRASPLFIGPEPLSSPILDTIAQRLRDTLVGDVVRGVHVGLEGGDQTLSRAGPLESVAVRWFSLDRVLGGLGADGLRATSRAPQDGAGSRNGGGGAAGRARKRGLYFEMRYENTLCAALLLPRLREDAGSNLGAGSQQGAIIPNSNVFAVPGLPLAADDSKADQFLHMPMLLLRMPAPLKTIITDFISRTFDCRIAPLHLGTRSLLSSLEQWIDDVGAPSSGPLAKDVALTLGFHLPAAVGGGSGGDGEGADLEKAGLRSIDIVIAARDLDGFLRQGRAEVTGDGSIRRPKKYAGLPQGWEDDPRERSRLSGGGKEEEGWGWMTQAGIEGDDLRSWFFTGALSRYLDEQLSLNLFHPCVRITRIACGGFVLSESRLKIFSLGVRGEGSEMPAAVAKLASDLVDRAL